VGENFTLSKEAFLQKLHAAKKGTKIAYHVGLLMVDREKNEKYTPEVNAYADKVNEVADAAWKAAGMKFDKNLPKEGQWRCNGHALCALTQRRLSDPLGFEYIAVKL
jgi:hypothetical protein